MEVLIMIILANVLIITIIFYSKIYIHLKYQYDTTSTELTINVYSFKKILKYKMLIATSQIKSNNDLLDLQSKIKLNKEPNKNINYHLDNHGGLKHVFTLLRYFINLYFLVMKKFQTSLDCVEFKWRTTYGTEDAALTAIFSGILWMIKSLTITKLKKNAILISKPVIGVKHIFGTDILKMEFECILSMRLGNVMNIIRNLYVIKL